MLISLRCYIIYYDHGSCLLLVWQTSTIIYLNISDVNSDSLSVPHVFYFDIKSIEFKSTMYFPLIDLLFTFAMFGVLYVVPNRAFCY